MEKTIEEMNKEQMVSCIQKALGKPVPKLDIKDFPFFGNLGAEGYYDEYYAVGKFLTTKQLKEIKEDELRNLLKLAGFLSEIFY